MIAFETLAPDALRALGEIFTTLADRPINDRIEILRQVSEILNEPQPPKLRLVRNSNIVET